MKFNEFKPQLTEEQIVLAYCKGDITKKDAVSHLSEMKVNLSEISLRDLGNKLSFGAIDSTAQQAAQDKALKDFKPKAGNTANQNVKAKIKAGQAGIDSVANLPGFSVGANKAQAAPLPKAKGPFKSGDGAEVDDFRAMPKTPPKPAARAKVKATAANTRDYDQTMAMQKKLIAQGANIKADGLMGPNTRAAMKAANMGAGGQKMRTDMPGGPRISNAKKPLMKPKATTAATKIAKKPAAKKPVAKKPRTLGKQNSKMPKSFGGIGPRVDDPKGGETVNLPFGMSYKTLPQQKDDGVA
jgi:hypothetical protein